MSDSNQAELIYVENDSSDVMPVNSDAWRPFRIAGSDGLTSTPNTVQSNESRSDRNRSGVILTSRDTGGPVPGEFSADTWDDFLAAVFQGTWTSDVLVNGLTKKSFTFLRTFGDFAAIKRIRYDKVRVDSFAFNFTYGQIVSVTIGLVGAGVDSDAADPLGTGTLLPAFTTLPMSTVDLQDITLNGISTGLCVESGSVTFTNNHRRRNCVENGPDPTDNTVGSFNVASTLRVYNSDASFPLHDVKNNQTAVGFSFGISDGTSTYDFDLPTSYLSFSDASNKGLDTDVMLDIALTSTYDETLDATAEITKS